MPSDPERFSVDPESFQRALAQIPVHPEPEPEKLVVTRGKRTYIYSKNCPRWVIQLDEQRHRSMRRGMRMILGSATRSELRDVVDELRTEAQKLNDGPGRPDGYYVNVAKLAKLQGQRSEQGFAAFCEVSIDTIQRAYRGERISERKLVQIAATGKLHWTDLISPRKNI